MTASNPPRATREPREPPAWSPAGWYPDQLVDSRRALDQLRVHHLDLTLRTLTASRNQFYVLDFFVGTVLARSYALVKGFLNAFDTWNPIVAAPLLRMQIDSLVRMAYTAAAPSADAVAWYVVKGGEFRNLKDVEGKKLTDRRLIELASPSHRWLEDVYSETSGWVHLSPEHFRATFEMRENDDEPQTLTFTAGVPIRREAIPVDDLKALIDAMIRATGGAFRIRGDLGGSEAELLTGCARAVHTPVRTSKAEKFD